MTLGIDVRRLTVAVLATVALFVAIAAAAPKADAFSATKSGDHYTVTITKAEVVGGATSAICKYYAGNYGWLVCPPLAATAQAIVGKNGGVQILIYTNGRVSISTYK
jgi:hypothetical protein